MASFKNVEPVICIPASASIEDAKDATPLTVCAPVTTKVLPSNVRLDSPCTSLASTDVIILLLPVLL